jgi:hypothetical protein
MDSTKYSVAFMLENINTGSNLSTAEVKINAQIKNTSINGETSFHIAAGSHHAKFSKSNYLSSETDYEIASDTSFTIGLEQTHAKVKFVFRNGSQPQGNVLVIFDEDSLYTNQTGVCTFNTKQLWETFTFTAKKEDYHSLESSL